MGRDDDGRRRKDRREGWNIYVDFKKIDKNHHKSKIFDQIRDIDLDLPPID